MATIICFGKNYHEHMHELGDRAVEKPVIFLKPMCVLRQCEQWNKTVYLHLPNDEIHYECEIVFKLKSGGFELSKKQAQDALGWYTIGVDMTKRVLQKQLKEDGHPWTIGKVFPDAAIIGPWLIVNDMEKILNQSFSFLLNSKIRQENMGKNMLLSPVDLVMYVSQYFPLCEGDILFCGTPGGVGKISKNDVAEIKIGQHAYFATWV